MDSHLSPAQVAKRFGISIKALRLYEQRGLLKPLRAATGSTGAAWRVYGPDQLARLHQILVLKRLGLSLGQIGELLGDHDALDPILAIQERTLAEDGERIARALALIRTARNKLASGARLSIGDLATLTQETVMTTPSTTEELKEALAPFRKKHLTPEDEASLKAGKEWASAASDVQQSMELVKQLMQEAKTLMAAGSAATPAALDFARRFRATSKHLKGSAPAYLTDLTPKFKTMLDDARTDPDAARKLEVFAFIKEALASLKAQEECGASERR